MNAIHARSQLRYWPIGVLCRTTELQIIPVWREGRKDPALRPYHPSIMISSRIASPALVAFVSILLATQPASAIQARTAEHARLVAMVGTWDVELTFLLQPGTKPIVTKGTSTIRALFDGLFIEEKIEGTLMGAPFTTMAWTGFNTDSKKYEATRIASTNSARISETGVFDEKTKEIEMKADYALMGDIWHQRTVIQQTSNDAMIAASYLSFGAVPEWKGVEIKYTRK